MAQKPSIPKGTRDFSPTEVAKRNYIFSTIKQVFETFGFQPIETPSFENSDTLMGKYGEEGDRLIFKILESGEYYDKAKKKLSLIDSEQISYLTDLLNSVFFKIRVNLKNQCVNNFSGDEKYVNMKIISNYLKDKIQLILNSCSEIIYINGFENNIANYFKDNSISIAIKIVNRTNFFTDDNTFEAFRLVEQKEIFNDLLESIKSYLILNAPISKLTKNISEKALRYDLTVPFARYVVQHQNEIEFPFKRYQMQPVWRADRPQKGRFREFYQCDADVVGSKGLWQEVEFVQLYDAVFNKLKLEGVTIKLNNRKILAGIAEIIGEKDKLIDFTVALDKLDKIGANGVIKEMQEKGISEKAIEKVQPLFSFNGTNLEKLDQLQEMLSNSEEGLQGVTDLRFVVNTIETLGLKSSKLTIDVTLARGLNYYTGAIYEVSTPEGVNMGSIGGGGRYDDLTGIFGLKDMSGVGISFGLDRIYLVLEELNLFNKVDLPKPKVLFVNFGEVEALYCMKALAELRKNNIKSELYPDSAKMKKQMNYANRRDIPFVVIVGTNEIANKKFTLKNMQTGEQQLCSLEELLKITIQH